MVALGSAASRYHQRSRGDQLVIAISVPKRDFAAALIACGWVFKSKAPELTEPLQTLRGMKNGQPLRAVNSGKVIAGFFSSLDETEDPPRAKFAGKTWRVDRISTVAAIDKLDSPSDQPRPVPGSIECMYMSDLARTWDARLALPAADLAIVGSRNRLEQDLSAYLGRDPDGGLPSLIESILRPKTDKSATWYTRLYSSSSLEDRLPLPRNLNAVILDGSGAISYLGALEAPVVICVIDRSIADESGGERVVASRNTGSEPLSVSGNLGWSPPKGVEALAFRVPL
jgi:hypothetical protein